jgi:HAMP domain-containing protein
VLRQVLHDVPGFVLLGAALGLIVAVWTRQRLLLALSGLGAGWIAIVAVMAQTQRSTGVSRYVLPTYAVLAVLAGAGWFLTFRLLRAERVRGPVRVGSRIALGGLAAVMAVTAATSWVGELRGEFGELRYQRGLQQALPAAVARSGGANKIRSCGRTWTSMYQVPFVAWTLHERIGDVWSLQAPGLTQPEYVGPLLQTRDRRDAPVAPVPFSFLRYRSGGSADASEANWTIQLPADCR